MPGTRIQSIGWCEPCQKYFWPTRRIARAVAKQHHGDRKTAYPCPVNREFFHVGGLWPEVKRGHLGRGDMNRGQVS
jgi:hypothetical protein